MAQIKDYTEQTVLNNTDEFVLQETGGGTTKKTLFSTIISYVLAGGGSEPIGTIKAWDKTFPSTPALSAYYVECNGSSISDASSPFNGYRSRNLNGANVVLTLTWTADGGGAYATVSATDLTALQVGDDVSGSGIAASSYISDITGTTVTITDTAASGSISSTFTNDGLFVRGGSTSGTGQKDAMQQLTGSIDGNRLIESFVSVTGVFSDGGAGTGLNAQNTTGNSRILDFDSADSPGARTGTETRPVNKSMVWLMKIK